MTGIIIITYWLEILKNRKIKNIIPYEKFINEKKDPCWPGYKQIGTKKKKGRIVPNCVKE
jgi:hypothetical protein